METIINEIQKVKKVLEILDFSEKDIVHQLDKLNKILLMKISVETLEKKGYRSDDGEFDYAGIEKFMKENYSQEEIQKISKEIGAKLIGDYFFNIMKNITDERKIKIEAILNS